MLKENCSSFDYILALGMCLLTFFIWWLYRKEKNYCKIILAKQLDDRHVVTIKKSHWNDLMVIFTEQKAISNVFVSKTIYNPQYIITKRDKQIKWKKN